MIAPTSSGATGASASLSSSLGATAVFARSVSAPALSVSSALQPRTMVGRAIGAATVIPFVVAPRRAVLGVAGNTYLLDLLGLGRTMTMLKGGLIQMSLKGDATMLPQKIRDAMLEAHLPLIEEAGRQRVQVLCLQEVFTQPYFCPSQDAKWHGAAEPVPDGPTVRLMQEYAEKHAMVIVVPIYEEEITGVYYNTAAVIDADGKYLGKYRNSHIPQVAGFWEKFFFTPGNTGYTTFQTAYSRFLVAISYDRHLPAD